MAFHLRENVSLALRAVRGNKLRTILTILIIAFGIMALVGILTAIDSIKSSIYSNFSMLGSNTFNIVQSGLNSRRHGDGEEQKLGKDITYEEARNFKDRFSFPARVSVSLRASNAAQLQNGSLKTNPTVRVFGVDENYFQVSGYELAEGRFFSDAEVKEGYNAAVIGMDVVTKLFPDTDPLEKNFTYGSVRYQVIGVLRKKGSSFSFAGDNQVFIPLLNVMRNFTGFNRSVFLSVQVNTVEQLDAAVSEATGLMRNVRGQRLGEADNFEIMKSDAVANSVISNISYVTLGATLIGFITLFGAAIGLMNIMLVSVTERTREIGVSKALGARKSTVRMQFLVEAIVICQLGGLLGIVLGIMIGNLVSLLIGGHFIVPWLWMMLGILFCFIVGLASGIYPAVKASNLDPIEALRYE